MRVVEQRRCGGSLAGELPRGLAGGAGVARGARRLGACRTAGGRVLPRARACPHAAPRATPGAHVRIVSPPVGAGAQVRITSPPIGAGAHVRIASPPVSGTPAPFHFFTKLDLQYNVFLHPTERTTTKP